MKAAPCFAVFVAIIALMVALMPGTTVANRDPPKNPNCGAPFCGRAHARALGAGQEVGTVKAATGSGSEVDEDTSVVAKIKRWM